MSVFLGLLYRVSSPLETEIIQHYSHFAIRQVKRLLTSASIIIQIAPYLIYEEDEVKALENRFPNFFPSVVQLRAELDALQHLFRIQSLIDTYDTASDEASPISLDPFDFAQKLREELEIFLAMSVPQNGWKRWGLHVLFDGITVIQKRMGAILAFVLVGVLIYSIEIVYSLLLNNSLWTAACTAYVLVPLASWWYVIYRHRNQLTIPLWDIGGRPFRSFRYSAVEPGRYIVRWPFLMRDDTLLPSVELEHDLDTEMMAQSKGRDPELYELTSSPADIAGASDILHLIVKNQLSKLALFLGWLIIGGGVCWTYISWGDFSATITDAGLTIYITVALLCALPVVATVIDFWDFYDAWPIRLLLLIAGAMILFFLYRGWTWFFVLFFIFACIAVFYFGPKSSPILITVVAFILFLAALWSFLDLQSKRNAIWRADAPHPTWSRIGLNEWPHGDDEGTPVVVMAASGGGSRAAYFTGLTLEHLHKDFSDIAQNLQAISSVSGGSLANAGYLARRLSKTPINTLSNAVTQDFLLPTLRGVVMPFMTRGDSVEKAWEGLGGGSFADQFKRNAVSCNEAGKIELNLQTVALGAYCLNHISQAWKEVQANSPPALPIPLFNSATLDGHIVVLSPMEKALYKRKDLPKSPDVEASGDQRTWVFNRDGIYGLEELIENFNPSLAAATRASANFPFGFPLVHVKTRKPLHFSPLRTHRTEGKTKNVYLTDGGALSNSGMLPLFNLLTNDVRESERERSLQEKLKHRGVLLIIVEASQMPTYPLFQATTDLWGTITDQSPIGQRLHRHMFDQLQQLYQDKIAIWQIDLTPKIDRRVLTTWALGTRVVKSLRRDFDDRWNQEQADLQAKWNWLKCRQKTDGPTCRQQIGELDLISDSRPPLD